MAAIAQPMTARRQVRLAIVSELKAKIPGDFPDITIVSPGVWPTPPEKLPALLVNTTTDSKQSINRGMAEFTTTLSVVVQGQVAAATPEAAQDAIEALIYAVENAILQGYWSTRIVQQFTRIVTEIEVTPDGSRQLGGFRMTLDAETFEAFDPTAQAPDTSAWPPPEPATTVFSELGLHADLANVFDPSGTYPAPPFPEAVKPAPRESGPDGRDEGALDIQLANPVKKQEQQDK